MGDMNGGPGAGGYGQGNPYGRGPQQPRGGWGGGANPWGNMQGVADQFMQQLQGPLANWQQGQPPPQGDGWAGAQVPTWAQSGQNAPQGGSQNAPQSGQNAPQSGFKNAAGLYQQYQGMQPGAQRDALIRQAQGSDQGAAFNQAMKQAGYQLNTAPGGGGFSYSMAPGSESVMGKGQAPGYQPGSFSAGVAALNRGDPNARNMLGAAAGLPPQTGTYSSQGPQAGPVGQYFDKMQQWQGPQFTPEQRLMMESGRGQRGFWQGPTSPFGMQGPGGYNPYGQGPGSYNPYGGYGYSPQRPYQGGPTRNGAPK